MDDLESSLTRIIADNRAARLRSSARMSRLVDATAHNDQEVINDILDEITGDDSNETLGSDGTTQGVDGDARDQESATGSGQTEAESGG